MIQLPIGYDDFGEIIEKKLTYIDKSLFIKEVLDDINSKAIVITRPRRFGKTLNLSILHYFLASHVYGKATQGLFDHLEIANYGQQYLQHQGKYQVILITFKDVKQATFAAALEKIHELIIDVYDKHNYLATSDRLTAGQKSFYHLVLHRQASPVQMEGALQKLTECLSAHYGTKPWLLIDEYDTPIHAAYIHGYYAEMIEFMRGCLGSSLKNNPYLDKAVITGILRVAKESLFSGLNNLKVYSVLHQQYSKYFGFTESEVDAILLQADLSKKALEIKSWYNGYQFGSSTIYNPWSLANCVQENGKTEPYWINTSDNQLIKDLLKQAPLEFKAQFETLIRGQSTQQLINENMVFADLKKNTLAAWSLLLMSGYLTPVRCESQWNGTWCELRVPNQEVNNLYRTIIELWLGDDYGSGWFTQFTTALVHGNMEHFHTKLEEILLQIVSYHDLAKEPEAFFHGLLLGFIASLQESHEIKSNRESGHGRYDIMLIPKESAKLGVVIELKARAATDSTSLQALADTALQQIERQKYATEFAARGIQRVLKIAIAFQGKEFALQYAQH